MENGQSERGGGLRSEGQTTHETGIRGTPEVHPKDLLDETNRWRLIRVNNLLCLEMNLQFPAPYALLTTSSVKVILKSLCT